MIIAGMATAQTPLTDLGTLKTIFGISSADSSQDDLLSFLILRATSAILKYCHRDDFGIRTYTRVLSGANTPSLVTPDVPIQSISLTGTTTNNSNVVTGLPTTGDVNANNLFLYQSVFGPGIPQGAVISSVASLASGQISLGVLSNSVLVNAPATASGTNSLQFGVAVWLDDLSYGGSAYNSYAIGTLLQEGIDYYLDYAGGPGTPCESGIIYCPNDFWNLPARWVYGLITPQVGPPIKSVKAQYLAGFATIPVDVASACENMIANVRQARKFGQGVSSLSNDMSVSLEADKLLVGAFTPYVRSLLANYIVTPILGN